MGSQSKSKTLRVISDPVEALLERAASEYPWGWWLPGEHRRWMKSEGQYCIFLPLLPLVIRLLLLRVEPDLSALEE